jgi:hypothetical protein
VLHVTELFCIIEYFCFFFCSSESKSVVTDGEASTYLHCYCSLHISEWPDFDFRDAAHTATCADERGESWLDTVRLVFKCCINVIM